MIQCISEASKYSSSFSIHSLLELFTRKHGNPNITLAVKTSKGLPINYEYFKKVHTQAKELQALVYNK